MICLGSKRKKDLRCKARLEFISNNVNSVTGSSQLLTFYDVHLDKDINILIELGGCQENSILENYIINNRLLDKIDAKNLDFIIILHAHADHSILTPSLIGKSFEGKIITTKENKAILPAMWSDACYINEQEVDFLKKSKKTKDRVYKPYYKMSDIDKTKELMVCIPVDEMYDLTPNIQIRFLQNKHILGSVSCSIHLKDINSRVHKLFYSSDLGNINNAYFVSEKQQAPKLLIALFFATENAYNADVYKTNNR